MSYEQEKITESSRVSQRRDRARKKYFSLLAVKIFLQQDITVDLQPWIEPVHLFF